MGAETLDKSQIDARIMVNLDSEEEGVATVSCAGGVVATLTRPVVREHVDGATLTLDISGLQGGHSGSDIHLERGNGDLSHGAHHREAHAHRRAASGEHERRHEGQCD